uniref:protein EVI2A n=1 Tax=Jaculus jaculus TaxID=51337 RepID=UPI001E1AFBEE|nr:protein EVI2A [Jaculus jaculus]
MDMEHTGQYLHLAFLMTTVFSMLPEATANYTRLWANNTIWDPTIQNSMNRHQTESNPNPEMDYKVNSTNTPERTSSSSAASLTPTSARKLYPPYTVRNSSPTTESTESTSQSLGEVFKKDVCEQSHSNMAMLICLITIAVLFLICTLLFLSTVVLANKVSSLRRSKQVGKRQPRSNGDFLASSGLWAAESDTWKRAKQLTGPNLMMQSTGVLTVTREGKEEGNEKPN